MLCKAAAVMFCCVKLKVALLVLPQFLFMDTVSRGETAPAGFESSEQEEETCIH